MKPVLRSVTVSDPAVARALLSERGRQVLLAFDPPAPLSEAARRLEAPLNSVKYHLHQLLRLDLLRPVAGRTGAARYGRTGASYFIPYALTPATLPQDILTLLHQDAEARLAAALVASAQDHLRARGLWGVQVVEQGGRLELEHAVQHADFWNFTHPEAPAVLDLRGALRLSHADAKAFQRELLALVSRYRQRPGPQTHLLRLSLAPDQS